MIYVRDAENQADRNMHLDPITGAPGAHPLGTGIGAAGGAAAGMVIGAMGGPVGAAGGGVVGAVAGGLVGKDIGETVHRTDEERYWIMSYRREPYYNSRYSYEDYAPAYRAAYAHRMRNVQGFWEQAEIDLQTGWESSKDKSRLLWQDAKHAAHAAWHRVDDPAKRDPQE